MLDVSDIFKRFNNIEAVSVYFATRLLFAYTLSMLDVSVFRRYFDNIALLSLTRNRLDNIKLVSDIFNRFNNIEVVSVYFTTSPLFE